MDRNKNKQPIQEKICCQNKTKKKINNFKQFSKVMNLNYNTIGNNRCFFMNKNILYFVYQLYSNLRYSHENNVQKRPLYVSITPHWCNLDHYRKNICWGYQKKKLNWFWLVCIYNKGILETKESHMIDGP